MIQPDLCLPLDKQETGRWEEDCWQKETRPAARVVAGVLRHQEASLRQHQKQEDATAFGVEPEECGLGREMCSVLCCIYGNQHDRGSAALSR